MKAQQEFSGKFESYLFSLMKRMGMRVCRNPELNDGKKPDFLVEHRGRRCYVEATHIQEATELREKRGEENLKEQLDKRAPKGLSICLAYANDEEGRLTNQISKKAKGINEIVNWLSENQEVFEENDNRKEFEIIGIRINVRAYSSMMAQRDRVSWIKSCIWDQDEKDQRIRESLKEKYDKYTPEQESIGNVPLVIAIFDGMMDKRLMAETLYGKRIPYISIDVVTDEASASGIRKQNDGVWLNARSGTLEKRHNHLVAVWHFRGWAMSKAQPSFSLTLTGPTSIR